MDWIRENKVPATLLGVIFAGVLGLGYLLFAEWGAFSAARDEYASLGAQIAQIKGMALAPTEKNLKDKQALVDAYGGNVSRLGGALLLLQPVAAPLKQAEFQAKLKDRVIQIKNLAQQSKVSLPPEFGFGFAEYLGSLPSSDVVATELSSYLDGVEAIVKLAITSKVKSVDLLERAPLPNEKESAPRPSPQAAPRPPFPQPGMPAAAPAAIAEKRAVTVVLTLDQGALQLILSRLANPVDMKARPDSDQSFFTSLRLLRIENQTKVGPPRLQSAAAQADASSVPVPVATETPPAPAPDPAAAGTGAKPAEKGPEILAPPAPAAADSVPVIGQELLKVQMEIDLVKFLDAAKTSAAP